jgi:hypothetical protein
MKESAALFCSIFLILQFFYHQSFGISIPFKYRLFSYISRYISRKISRILENKGIEVRLNASAKGMKFENEKRFGRD